MAGPNKLVVGGLPLDISEEELQTVFGTYGEVLGIEILSEDRGARQAHVSYREAKSAEDAITVLHDIYKIRTDAEWPIQVWQFKEDVVMASPGAPAGGDWNSASKQDNSSWGASSPAAGAGGAGQKSGPPEDSHKLFVGGLPDDISEDELRSVFGTYGEVTNVHIMKANSVTGLRGAFVFYTKREAGEDAIKVLNDTYKIRTDAAAPIQVRWGKDGKGEGKGEGKGDGEGGGRQDMPNKLFVGSLPADITEEEIKTVFNTYGEVAHVHLMAPHAKTGMRAALVFYVRRESGEDAIKVLNEVYKFREDAESPIQVKWGKERDAGKGWDSKGGKGGKGWDSWGGGGNSWSGGSSWDSGKGGGGKGWQALGNGSSWDDNRSGGRSSWDNKDGWWQESRSSGGWNESGRDGGWGGSSKGWGGSDYGKGKGGDKGGSKGDKGYGKGKGDKGGYDRGYDKGGYDKGGKGGDKGKGKGGKSDYGRGGGDDNAGKLFVANLPEDIQDNALEYVFGTYGKVQKVHIMANNSRNGAIAAFVEFGTAEEAETAIASLNEKYEIRPGYGPILVRHANSSRRSRPY